MIVSKKDKVIYNIIVKEEIKFRKSLEPYKYIKYFPIQQKFAEDPARIKMLAGANRSGKTHCVSKYIIDKCMDKPKQSWWAVSETFQDSVNILQAKIYELMPKNGMNYARWSPVLGFTNKKIIFPNDSVVRFLSYEQGRESFQGTSQDGIVLDEEPPYDVYKECRMRLIDRNGEMLFSMTPLKGMTDLLLELYEGSDYIETEEAPLLGNELVPRIAEKNGVKFYFLWSSENKYIDSDRLKVEALSMDKNEIKSRMYGLPTGVALRIYPQYSENVHVVKWEDIPDRLVTLYMVLDPHDRKPWAMQWWVVTKTGTCYCVWEYPYKRNFNEMDYDDKTFEDYAEVIDDTELTLMEIFGRRVSRRIIDPNFGNKTVQLAVRTQGQSKTTPKKELKRLGFNFIDGIDSLSMGHMAVKNALHWEEKDGEIVVQPSMYVAEHCQNTRRHLARYSFTDIETASGDVRGTVKPKEKYKDYADLCRYFRMSDPHYIAPVTKKEIKVEKIY